MTYREGWGVYVEPLWGFQTHYEDTGEEIPDPFMYEPSHVEDIVVKVVRLGPTTEVIVGNAICVHLWDKSYCPMENFERLEGLERGRYPRPALPVVRHGERGEGTRRVHGATFQESESVGVVRPDYLVSNFPRAR